MSGSKPKLLSDPGHAAHLFLMRARRTKKITMKECEDLYPDEVKLAREYKADYMRKYNASRVKKEYYSYIAYELMSWPQVSASKSKWAWAVAQRITLTQRHEMDADRECASYYTMIMKKNLEKMRLHPEIRPMSLGGDPRKRKWPSGLIKYNLQYRRCGRRLKNGTLTN